MVYFSLKNRIFGMWFPKKLWKMCLYCEKNPPNGFIFSLNDPKRCVLTLKQQTPVQTKSELPPASKMENRHVLTQMLITEAKVNIALPLKGIYNSTLDLFYFV